MARHTDGASEREAPEEEGAIGGEPTTSQLVKRRESHKSRSRDAPVPKRLQITQLAVLLRPWRTRVGVHPARPPPRRSQGPPGPRVARAVYVNADADAASQCEKLGGEGAGVEGDGEGSRDQTDCGRECPCPQALCRRKRHARSTRGSARTRVREARSSERAGQQAHSRRAGGSCHARRSHAASVAQQRRARGATGDGAGPPSSSAWGGGRWRKGARGKRGPRARRSHAPERPASRPA